MPCSPANEPELIQATDLIYSPAQFERRFFTGWWTRGLIPLDNFLPSNWAGLVKPASITFSENEITISYPGRWWESDGCVRSMPKVTLHLQYVCKGGRLYLHTDVWYGKNYTQQTYSGHNGAQKFSRIPLEKTDEQCSLEQTAGIPQEKADIVELKHVADWIVTMLSAPGVEQIGEPNTDWITLFADYTESDLTWAPCDGCLFPTQNYSIPVVKSDDNMLQLEARLVVQNVKALGDILLLSTVPETFNVPMCLHNTYLEVSLPDLAAVMHMREFFDCQKQYFGDEYYTLPVNPSDIQKCFTFPEPEPEWPKKDDPKWVDVCKENRIKKCSFNAGYNSTEGTNKSTEPYEYFGGYYQEELCGGNISKVGKAPSATKTTNTVVASNNIEEEWSEITCVKYQSYFGGFFEEIQCLRMKKLSQTILFEKEVPSSEAPKLMTELLNSNSNWTCNSQFKGPSGGGAPPPIPDPSLGDGPQGPKKEGDCFFEAELSYRLNLNTVLGSLNYELSIPIRAKVPKGTTNLGPISANISGDVITITTALGGNFTASLNGVINGFNAVGRTITSIVPATFGLRNVRILCP